MATYEYERRPTWFDVTTHRSPKLQRLDIIMVQFWPVVLLALCLVSLSLYWLLIRPTSELLQLHMRFCILFLIIFLLGILGILKSQCWIIFQEILEMWGLGSKQFD